MNKKIKSLLDLAIGLNEKHGQCISIDISPRTQTIRMYFWESFDSLDVSHLSVSYTDNYIQEEYKALREKLQEIHFNAMKDEIQI